MEIYGSIIVPRMVAIFLEKRFAMTKARHMSQRYNETYEWEEVSVVFVSKEQSNSYLNGE
jgi:hypothetical protein